METRKRKHSMSDVTMSAEYEALRIAEQGKPKKRRTGEAVRSQRPSQTADEVAVAQVISADLPVVRIQPQETLTTKTIISVLQDAALPTPIVINHEQRIDFSSAPGVPLRISSSATISRPIQQEAEDKSAAVDIKSTYTYGSSSSLLIAAPTVAYGYDDPVEADRIMEEWIASLK